MKHMMNEEEEDVWQNHIIFFLLFFINQSFRLKMATALKGKENKNRQLWHPTYLITLSRKNKLICFQKQREPSSLFSNNEYKYHLLCGPQRCKQWPFCNRAISLPKMQAMTILQIELSLSQRCQQWASILQSSDISSKDASNDHSFCTRVMSLPKMQAMTIHFAIERRCLS